jgi:hypothetical protein
MPESDSCPKTFRKVILARLENSPPTFVLLPIRNKKIAYSVLYNHLFCSCRLSKVFPLCFKQGYEVGRRDPVDQRTILDAL